MIDKIVTRPPAPFERGDQSIWTDAHVARSMLEVHFDEQTEQATRQPAERRATLTWIGQQVPPGARVLDLGCGPGIYANELARRGYRVTGFDWSSLALDRARADARSAGLAVDYHRQNYVDDAWPPAEPYDAVLLIWCDFGTLGPERRTLLLGRVFDALRPGGLFCFDVFDPGVVALRDFGCSWTLYESGGFWSPNPHLVLQESVHQPARDAFFDRFQILESGREPRCFINWTRYYERPQLERVLGEAGFAPVEVGRIEVADTRSASLPLTHFVVARKPAG